MHLTKHKSQIKIIGQSGQLSLGKEYAGRTVLIEEIESGVWRIRTASIIPDNERWLHEPQTRASLERAMTHADKHPPQTTNLEEIEQLKDAKA